MSNFFEENDGCRKTETALVDKDGIGTLYREGSGFLGTHLFGKAAHQSGKPRSSGKIRKPGKQAAVRFEPENLVVYFGCGPLPVTVTTRNITYLVGDSYKPSFATVTGRGHTQCILYTNLDGSKIRRWNRNQFRLVFVDEKSHTIYLAISTSHLVGDGMDFLSIKCVCRCFQK